LLAIKSPPAAIASILHRISGVVVFLLIPFALVLLQHSLASEAGFDSLKVSVQSPLCKMTLWVFLAGLVYHFIAGIRHLFMDAHQGESLVAGRITAHTVMILSAICIILIGFWLWH
jgi:succinate dehydrogenase / fumarate reductase cytochrome b subunit